MADQDFNINIRTIADLTGIKLTKDQLNELKISALQGNQQAIAALGQLTSSVKQAQSGIAAGSTASAVGVGTIVTLLTTAINRWKAFDEAETRAVEKMLESEAKFRALGESILAIQDAMISERRIGVEPLQLSLERLQKEYVSLQTQQSLLDLPTQGEEWKKINEDLLKHEALIKRVAEALKQQAIASDRTAKANQQAAFDAASPQAKAILANEKAAREAKAAGDQKSADLLQKSADKFRESASAADLAGVQAVSDTYGKAGRPGRAAGVGESQELVDQMERNRKASEGLQTETGTGGPSLIGDEARKAREAGEKTASMGEEVEFQKRQALMRTAHQSKQAAADREEANARLRGENRAGEIERQTQDAKKEGINKSDLQEAIRSAFSDAMDKYWR